MQLKQNFVAVNRTLQNLTSNTTDLFGVQRGGRVQIVNACIRYWSEWHRIQQLFLTDNMHVVEGESNQRFANWLSDLPYTPSQNGAIDISEWIRTTNDQRAYRDFVYPLHQLQAADNSIFRDCAILISRNDSVDRFNREIAQLRTIESYEYFAVDQVQRDEAEHITDYPTEYLQSLAGSGLPHGVLKLQMGMPVILVRDYYSRPGLRNGTRLIITQLFNHCINIRVISPDSRYDGQCI
ncbi:hypothetical protein EPUL_002870 [Erysiphe pulchra]|uniref:DNA helicase Pif1-like 2B domain-containing protein n=1 Tax=Erysiphe pulchra TaxID=225359 RepID=A0A2S4PQU3_9PEZI|nr:hypothetical protein EPUL_002870 [Erysiphe pulchra]